MQYNYCQIIHYKKNVVRSYSTADFITPCIHMLFQTVLDAIFFKLNYQGAIEPRCALYSSYIIGICWVNGMLGESNT